MERTNFKNVDKENWTTKVGSAARKDVKKKPGMSKEEMKVVFAKKYDKLKTYKFKYMNELNDNSHRYLPKYLLHEGLSKPALILYPVLCHLADYKVNKWFQLSIENLAKASGLSAPSVIKAISELQESVLIVEKKIEGKRHYNRYKIHFIRENQVVEERGNYITFFSMIIELGLWAQISNPGKVLYLYLRSIAEYDAQEYAIIENIGYDEINETNFRDRKWDLAELNITQLSKLLRINYADIGKAIRDLEFFGLCERTGRYCLVYLKPKDYYQYYDE